MSISAPVVQSDAPALRPATDEERRAALIAGVLFLITFVTSIGAVLLYDPVINDTGYITGAGSDTRVALGAVLELVLIIANIGTAVVLFPILRRQSESGALGYVTARLAECTFIAVGVLCLLSVVTLRKDLASGGANAATLDTVGRTLVAIRDWTFVLGPGFVVGVGNGLLLGYLMYASGLVPRRMTLLGLVGGPLICLSGVAVVFDVIDRGSTAQAIATIPEFFWELSLGIYMTVKGFRPSPILSGGSPESGTTDGPPSPAVSARLA